MDLIQEPAEESTSSSAFLYLAENINLCVRLEFCKQHVLCLTVTRKLCYVSITVQ